jgi:gluconolactonase
MRFVSVSPVTATLLAVSLLCCHDAATPAGMPAPGHSADGPDGSYGVVLRGPDSSEGSGPEPADAAPDHLPPDVAMPAPAGSPLAPAGFTCPPGASYGRPLPTEARATTLHAGFREAEGPVWVGKVLFVSDIDERNLGNGSLYRYTPATGQWEVVATKVGTNGLARHPDGAGVIVAACHDTPALFRIDPATGTRTLIAGTDSFEGKPFNEPNDLVVRNDGNIYFTDPKVQPGAKGRAGQGVMGYYRVSPAGAVTRIAVAPQPNGIALSPDGRYLYVAGGFPLRRHEVAADGAVTATFVELAGSGSDGMGVDCAGNLYLTTGNGVLVLGPDGKSIGSIAVPSSGFITNVAFGGDDARTLFITTRNAVHQLRVEVPGFPN